MTGGVQLSEALAMRLQAMEFADRLRSQPGLARKDRYKPPPSPTRLVRINHDTTAGKCVQANASGFHPGKFRKWHTGEGEDAEGEIWIVVSDGDDDQTTREAAESIGFYAGRAEHEGENRPLYVVFQGQISFKAKADSTITAGGSGTVSIWTSGSDSSINVTALLNWMHGSQDVASTNELEIRWYPGEGWVITGAACS